MAKATKYCELEGVRLKAVQLLSEMLEDEAQRDEILAAATSPYGHAIEWDNGSRAYSVNIKLDATDDGWLTCSDCGGSGEGRWEGSTCLRCKGYGDARHI